MGHEELGSGASAQIGADRDRTAEDRDHIASAHDRAAEARDARASARDDRAETRERTADRADSGAVADRAGALRDRRGGASDRTQSAADRDASAVDRVLSAREREVSSIDELTDVYRRDAGLLELEREITRAGRTQQSYVIAFVDVDHLKVRNDTLGHAAGDQLLRAIADAIRAHLRASDLVIRVGGDEFVCALPDLGVAAASQRFARISADLVSQQASITVGFAELEVNDTLDDLIARADAAMYQERRQRQPG